MLGEEVIRFMQKVELLRIASAPFAEAAVKAKPEPRANGQWTVAAFRGSRVTSLQSGVMLHTRFASLAVIRLGGSWSSVEKAISLLTVPADRIVVRRDIF